MGEQHRYFVPFPRIAFARHDDTGEIDLLGPPGALQSHGHFGPGGKGLFVAKFNAVFPDAHRTGGHGQALSGCGTQS